MVVSGKTTVFGCFFRRDSYLCREGVCLFNRYNMEIKGVLTGDIIHSTTIQADWRERLLETIRGLVDELQLLSPMRMEFFRGDSFQILVEKPGECLTIAVLLRAGLKSKTPEESAQLWDARIAVGVGDVTYTSEQVVVSDGDAFRFSGWAFDELGKRTLAVRTPWQEVNDELRVSTAFADDIISGWSVSQAEAVYLSLLHQTSQKDIAAYLQKTAQNISKLLSTGKETLIRLYLERYEQIILNKGK